MDSDEFCRTLAEELNVKKVTFCLPIEADGKRVDLSWTESTGLYVNHGGDDVGAKELARSIFLEYVVPSLRRKSEGSKS